MMPDFFLLKKIDLQLQKIINPISFFDVNPINLESEKLKVLENQDYNPFFIYSSPSFDFDSVQSDLGSIDESNSILGKIINQKRNLFIDKCQLLKSRGSSNFTSFSKKVYGMPLKPTLEHAASLLTLKTTKEKKTISSKSAAGMLQAEINHHRFNYKVYTKPMTASAMVLVSKKLIYIKSGSVFSKNYVQRLITHEIGTHVLRAENGLAQPFMIFFHGFPGYLETEEGLAANNEQRFGLLNNANLKNYAARSIAVKMAMSSSFSKIYTYLLDYFTPKTAFKIAARAKRGIGDTSKPGGCTKDYIYMSGFLKVKKYLDDGGDISKLYIGKIGLDHLKLLSNIDGLSEPKHLPKNQTFKNLLAF